MVVYISVPHLSLQLFKKKSHTIIARDLMCETGEQLGPFSYPSTMYDTSFYSYVMLSHFSRIRLCVTP